MKHLWKTPLCTLSALVLAACGGGADNSVSTGGGVNIASTTSASSDSGDAGSVASQHYIVVFNDTVGDPDKTSLAMLRSFPDSTRTYVYKNALKGFAVSVPEADAENFVTVMTNDRHVALVSDDGMLEASEAATTGSGSTTQLVSRTVNGESRWGLDRIDQRSLPMDGVYKYDTRGAQVRAYVLDSITSINSDFATRTAAGYDAVLRATYSDQLCDPEQRKHGTHVASIIAGGHFGVADQATIVPVRVLGCDGKGRVSQAIAGLDWVVSDVSTSRHPSVVNMSISGPRNMALDRAVAGAIGRGISVVAAAGNEGRDACDYGPGRVEGAIIVGATNRDDQRARFSNWGACVDVFAPGVDIRAADTATQGLYLSGTSQAAAHTAGVVARMLSADPTLTPAQIESRLKADATKGALEASSLGRGSPNLLLFAALLNGEPMAAPAPAPAPAPAAGPSSEPEPEPAPAPSPDDGSGSSDTSPDTTVKSDAGSEPAPAPAPATESAPAPSASTT